MSVADLPVSEPMPPHFEEMLGWPENRIDRVAVQNYYDGRIKLVKENQVSFMTSRLHNEKKGRGEYSVAPIWRRLTNGETKELWPLQVRYMYYHNKGIMAQANYADLYKALINKAKPPEDLNMIPDKKLAKKYRDIANAMKLKDRYEKDANRYAKQDGDGRLVSGWAKDILDYLMVVVKKHRQGRDVEQAKTKEQAIFEQETIRERAKQRVVDEMPKRRGPPPKERIGA